MGKGSKTVIYMLCLLQSKMTQKNSKYICGYLSDYRIFMDMKKVFLFLFTRLILPKHFFGNSEAATTHMIKSALCLLDTHFFCSEVDFMSFMTVIIQSLILNKEVY